MSFRSALILLLALATTLFADSTFTVNPRTNCGSSAPASGPEFYIEAGTHHLRWDGGAYSAWSSDAAHDGTAWRCMIHAYIHQTGEFLRWTAGVYYATQAEAANASNGTVFPMEFPVDSWVTFCIQDSPCSDNRGMMTLTLLDDPVAEADELPAEFSLSQNYPNPFNPATTIEYSLVQTAEVELAVYDLSGRRLALLESGLCASGEHQIQFDARELASGVYLYALEVEGVRAVRRMVILK